MKYARINIETIGFHNHVDKAHINFGDHLQNIIIKDLYKKMGIAEDDIYVLDFNEISTYDGEYLILPINQAISHNIAKFLSNKIIPVFLGLSRDPAAISSEEEQYLRDNGPIGCRDQALFDYLRQKRIPCYLNGCMSITLDKRLKAPDEGFIYIIDAPQYVIDNIPKDKKEKLVILENTFYGTYGELRQNNANTVEDIVRNRYQLLKDTASLVVTSRMHIASPCIGMGVPIVLARNTIDYRFSWIDKYLPIYLPKDARNIDWNPQSDDQVESIKKYIIDNAIYQIKNAATKYQKMFQISEFYESRRKVTYDLPHFSKLVIDFVTKTWPQETALNYSIWGENDASEVLYQYMSKNYPNAHFIDFYDSYKKIIYHGKVAKHPREIKPHDNTFIFVTGYTATDAAKELFNAIGRDKKTYFLFENVVRGYLN